VVFNDGNDATKEVTLEAAAAERGFQIHIEQGGGKGRKKKWKKV